MNGINRKEDLLNHGYLRVHGYTQLPTPLSQNKAMLPHCSLCPRNSPTGPTERTPFAWVSHISSNFHRGPLARYHSIFDGLWFLGTFRGRELHCGLSLDSIKLCKYTHPWTGDVETRLSRCQLSIQIHLWCLCERIVASQNHLHLMAKYRFYIAGEYHSLFQGFF